MKEFLFVFRTDYMTMMKNPPSPEEMQAMTKKWMDWMGGIAAQNIPFERGNRLSFDGKVVKPNNVVTDGPYTEIKESIGGYSKISVDSYEKAVAIAKGCPILTVGGNVEIREINQM